MLRKFFAECERTGMAAAVGAACVRPPVSGIWPGEPVPAARAVLAAPSPSRVWRNAAARVLRRGTRESAAEHRAGAGPPEKKSAALMNSGTDWLVAIHQARRIHPWHRQDW